MSVDRAPPLLTAHDLTLRAGSRLLVSGLSFSLAPGERLVLVGGNGTGKSTLLAVLAGLRAPEGGRVERPASPPGMLFQDGALWPHMTVAQHLAFVDVDDDPAWRSRLLELHQLAHLADARPETLSGGERLRLGLARALAGRPRWVLLDEPLAHLDPGGAALVRETLPLLLDELEAAAITVTHDADEVLLMGDRLLELTGRGPWWLGSASVALDAAPTSDLAAFSGRGNVLSGQADGEGRVDLGLGLQLEGCPPGRPVRAFLDAASVRLGDGDRAAATARFVAPDRRGGSWVRLGERLLRSGDGKGVLRPGDEVSVRIVGRPRLLDEPSAP